MKLIMTLSIIFLILFLFIFLFIKKENIKEPNDKKLNMFGVTLVSLLLALIPTAVFGIILLTLLGSSILIDHAFSLNIDIQQLIILAISLFIYFYSLDRLIEILLKYLFGENLLYQAAVFLTRGIVIFTITQLIGLGQTSGLTLSIGLVIIVMILEKLYDSSGMESV
ncbi:hypothetical protein ACTWQB_09310 [Piscibacillus sp. B03]|uniref:hypothetical protein n=1 Tax=Piscibacillus sp. B03 TaxID=3457430 RepID=UPI003FCE86C6